MSISPYLPVSCPDDSTAWNSTDECKTLRCDICDKTGYEEYCCEGSYEDNNGKHLPDALAHNGKWVCSKPCLSQLMFQSATPEEQYALKRVERALNELNEYLSIAKPAIENFHPLNASISDLGHSAQFAWDTIGYFDDPKWIQDNEARERTLELATSKAISDLEMAAIPLGIGARCAAEYNGDTYTLPSDYAAETQARSAASIGNIALRLKAALKEGE